MNRLPWAILALALLGASPTATPLVTGSVRDASGRPVAGATITARAGDGTPVSTTSDPDGTFALEGAGVTSVLIRCSFCQSTPAQVGPDGTVVAIVRRYGALLFEGPSAEDLANLPYTHIESDLALRPFTVLENSKSIVPGPQLGDRVIQPGGGLLVDDDIPSYDISTGISPFLTIPVRYTQNVSTLPQSEAFRSGDLADDGTFVLDPQSEGTDATVAGGSTIRAGAAGESFSGSLGASGDALGQRRRIDAGFDSAIAQGSLEFSVLASDGTSHPDATDDIGSSFSGAHVGIERTETLTERFDAYVDRGSYAATFPSGELNSTWSDSVASFTVRANTPVAPFATVGARTSAGDYNARSLGVPEVGAALTQTQAIFGVHAGGSTYDLTVAMGGYSVAYSGGYYGHNIGANTFLGTPVVHLLLTPGQRWTFDLSANGSFRLPTFAQRYGDAPVSNSLIVDRDATLESTVTYTDTARVRFAATALVRNTNGFDNGRIASVGESIAWQIAPALSVRTWWMHVVPDQERDDYGLQFGADPQVASIGSTWLSYANPSGLRVDAIWRQDLVNYLPDAHLDESLSAPLAPHLRWFVGSERLLGVRSINVGLRLARP